jgi:hypothetical protein
MAVLAVGEADVHSVDLRRLNQTLVRIEDDSRFEDP